MAALVRVTANEPHPWGTVGRAPQEKGIIVQNRSTAPVCFRLKFAGNAINGSCIPAGGKVVIAGMAPIASGSLPSNADGGKGYLTAFIPTDRQRKRVARDKWKWNAHRTKYLACNILLVAWLANAPKGRKCVERWRIRFRNAIPGDNNLLVETEYDWIAEIAESTVKDGELGQASRTTSTDGDAPPPLPRAAPSLKVPPVPSALALEIEIRAVLAKHSPSKIRNLPALLRRYSGNEADLLAKVYAKYEGRHYDAITLRLKKTIALSGQHEEQMVCRATKMLRPQLTKPDL